MPYNAHGQPENFILYPFVYDTSMLQYLESGTNYAFEKQGQWVLAHWPDRSKHMSGASFLAYFNPDDSVERMEFMYWPGLESPDEVAKFAPDFASDPHSAGLVSERIIYMNYLDYSGYRFPAVIRTEFPQINRPEIVSANEALIDKQIDRKEFCRRLLALKSDIEMGAVYEWRMDFEHSEINAVLGAEDFAIDQSPGAVIFDHATQMASTVPTPQGWVSEITNALRKYWSIASFSGFATVFISVAGYRKFASC